MGVAPAMLEGVPSEPTLADATAADAVLDHFDTHRPGPASFPSVALKLLDLVRDSNVEMVELARVIEQDPALTAGVLVLANSAVYRGLSTIQTVREAVARLGLGEVARLGAALSSRSLYKPDVRAQFDVFGPVWNRLYYHSAVVARAASELARARRIVDPDRVFVAGMLHDVGKSIAMRSLATLVLEGKVPGHDGMALDRILHAVHVDVGREVHREWRLPEYLVDVAAHHHDLEPPRGPEHLELHLVRMVSALHLLRTEPELNGLAAFEVIDSARTLGLGPARVEALCTSVDEIGVWVKAAFGDDAGGPAVAP
jgi:putative nucleotidyltransferase with HDIG domain